MHHIVKAWNDLDHNEPDKIAELLLSWGVQGKLRRGGDVCPLAEWLKRLDGNYGYFVYKDSTKISDINGNRLASLHHGYNIQQFINRFDSGNYPQLET